MPELPDVEVARRHLDAIALHRRIACVGSLDPAMVRGVSPARVRGVLAGSTLQRTCRHGKWLFARCGDGPWLVLHFGMTGRLVSLTVRDPAPVHTRLELVFDGDRLAFDCQRKLGLISLTDDVDRFVAERGLGPDALAVDVDELARVLGRRRGAAKSTLLNQHVLAGLGNVYADEALFHARLHPRASLSALDAAARRSLARRIRHVLVTAIERRADPDRLPRSWLLPRRRAGATCPRCGGTIERTRVGGRSAYYCPRCQRHGEVDG